MGDGSQHDTVTGWEFAAQSGLELTITTDAGSPAFAAFFAAYDKAFILPAEKEDVEGFRDCLALNSGAAHSRLARRFGPFIELCLVARPSERATMIGGANLFATRIDRPDGTAITTCNLNYVFTTPEARGKGLFRPLLAAIEELVASLFSPPPGASAPLIFVEQNDPFRMSPADYAADTTHSGVDQFDRLAIWAKVGARIIDFDYVQPPLTPDGEPDDTLVYALLTPGIARIEPELLRQHLERFFAISVLKGADLDTSPVARDQLGRLADLHRRHHDIALFDPGPLLAGDHERAMTDGTPRPRSIIAAIAARKD